MTAGRPPNLALEVRKRAAQLTRSTSEGLKAIARAPDTRPLSCFWPNARYAQRDTNLREKCFADKVGSSNDDDVGLPSIFTTRPDRDDATPQCQHSSKVVYGGALVFLRRRFWLVYLEAVGRWVFV